MGESEYRGQHIAVLGAASGIGRATALAYAARSAKVAALDRDAAGLEPLGAEMRAAGAESAVGLALDVRSRSSLDEGLGQAAAALGGLDHLIYTAGILRTGPLMDMVEDEFDDVFAINMKGVWSTMRAAVPLMRPGAARRRSITAIASAAALRPKTSSGAYAASKVALCHLVRVFAVELAGTGITVNAIAPSTVDTPMVAALSADRASNDGYKLSGASPLGRMGQPEDIAKACLYLSSEAAEFVTGIVMPVDGGSTAAVAAG